MDLPNRKSFRLRGNKTLRQKKSIEFEIVEGHIFCRVNLSTINVFCCLSFVVIRNNVSNLELLIINLTQPGLGTYVLASLCMGILWCLVHEYEQNPGAATHGGGI